MATYPNLYSPRFLRDLLYDTPLRGKWGQRFLIDKNIVEKIIEEADIKEGEAVLEIGPGIGTLTLPLAQRGARVYAIEKDRRVLEILREFLKGYPGVRLFAGDVLDMNLYSILRRERKWKVISNPPYSIVGPLLYNLLQYPSRLDFFLFMLQKEVAEKLVAVSGRKEYSLLTIKVRLYGEAKIVRRVPRQVFFPPPKVDSALVRIDIKRKRKIVHEDSIIKTAEKIFQKRRKMLKNVFPLPSELYQHLGISPEWRGEVLDVDKLVHLSKVIRERKI
ncbi:MAG: ribosomal RNA small subunit methyltransferase A [Caldiserica bacterium]|nr:ribosomal RNA small subunit methyltransferase A [Caldisericota bacterium]